MLHRCSVVYTRGKSNHRRTVLARMQRTGSIDELKQRLTEVWCGLEQSTVDMAIDQWRKRLRLKTHGVENPASIFDSENRHGKKVTMLLLLRLCIHIVVKCNKYKTKCNRNVYLPILHCLQTNKTNTTNFNQSQPFLSITCFRKSTSK